MGDPASPIRTKCQALVSANARVIERPRATTARCPRRTDPVQVCRLVGGVATVADQGELDADAVRPMLEVVADGLLR